jgi:hypothetical protein
MSRRVFYSLRDNQTYTLSQFVHPQRGIRFSPYVFLETKAGRVWSRSEIARAKQNRQSYNWGQRDGLEENIQLTWDGFRREFLVPRDFSRGTLTIQATRSRGNTINNLKQVYPDAVLAEFYLPGSRKYGGMDWNGLWLVWRPVKSRWYLAALVSDRWTT